VQHALSPRPFHPHQARRLLLDWSLPDHLWIGRKSRQFLPSQRSANARASIAAEIRALGPSCITSTPQLKLEWSPWAKIRLDPRKSTRLFKGIICDDISEFESSLSGRVGVKRFQTAPSILVLMSLAGILASLRDRHSGPPMMGSEGCGGPISRYVLAVRLTAGIKTRNGLASSIVPAGTSLHRVGGIQFSPIAIVHN
jgi:hypothetical protein